VGRPLDCRSCDNKPARKTMQFSRPAYVIGIPIKT
jgi:hypothetical protein